MLPDARQWAGRLVEIQLPDEPQALQRELRINAVERGRVRRDQLGQATRGDRLRVGPGLCSDAAPDRIDLTCEAVHEARLKRSGRRLGDHRRRLDELDA